MSDAGIAIRKMRTNLFLSFGLPANAPECPLQHVGARAMMRQNNVREIGRYGALAGRARLHVWREREAHDQATVAVELALPDVLEAEPFVERDGAPIGDLRVDHYRVGAVLLEDAGSCRPHRLCPETATSVPRRPDPDVKRPRPGIHVTPIVRFFLASIDELHKTDRAAVLLSDEQLTPRYVPLQLGRPVVPVGAMPTQSRRNIRIVVPPSEQTDIIDPHQPQFDHPLTICAPAAVDMACWTEGSRTCPRPDRQFWRGTYRCFGHAQPADPTSVLGRSAVRGLPVPGPVGG
jgi:hypothetical protein